MTIFKISAYITLAIAIALSSVAAFFSVLGLMEIFSASPHAIMVMAIVLEAAKVSTAFYAHLNWRVLPHSIKLYLASAVMVLMGITSLGIYGFLAKSHIVQTAEITANYGTKIKSFAAVINAKKQQIETIDQQIAVIDGVVATAANKGYVTKSLQLNKQYAKDKQELIDQKMDYQQQILDIEQRKIVVESNKLQSETKVGPLKYIANLIYGEASAEQINTSVRWLIIILVAVFDPLAIALLIGTGYVLRQANPASPVPMIMRKPVIAEKPKVVVRNDRKAI